MPLWLLLTMMMGGSYIQNKETAAANARAISRRTEGREEEKKVEEKQRQEVLGEAEALDPVLRQEALDLSAENTEQRINAVLADNKVGTTGDVGVVSEKLLDRRAQSVRDKANTASIMAALMSKTQAPGEVATDESRAILNLLGEARGNTGKLTRIGRKTNTLANLAGTPDASKLMLGGLMGSVGSSGLSASIMSGLQPPGGGYVGAGAPYAGAPQFSPDPNYIQPDAFGVAGIR